MEGKPDILVKSDENTNPEYGCTPDSRSIDERIRKGFIYINKPRGPTSHQVAVWVKDILGISKAGYSGTLDPHVTGVLPIALADSTKVIKVLNADKEYVGIMRLHDDVGADDILKVFAEFTGPIYQRPPVKSAVKRQLRVRTIRSLECIEIDKRKVLFKVRCEAGTYIRKLCHDIGLVLGCGAHMHELRRTKVADITEDDCITLHNLKDAFEYYKGGDEKRLIDCLIPVEDAVSSLAKIWMKDAAVDAICHGAALNAPGVAKIEANIKAGDKVALLSLKGELVSVAKCLKDSTDILRIKRGQVAKSVRVFMETEVYPRLWKND